MAGAGGGAETVLAERRDGVLILTLDRPPLNILNLEMLARLEERLDEALAPPAGAPAPDAIVLRAAGERAFSAGADVADHGPERAREMLERFHRAVRALWSAPCATIASVRGLALGAGMELVLSCDLVVAEEGAAFGQPEIVVGSFPPVAAALLPERIGRARAADLLLTGRRVEAREALALGLVSRLAPPGELDRATQDLLAELARSSPGVRRCALSAARGERLLEWSRRLEWAELIYLRDLLPLADAREGVEAFLEKRVPKWTSR